MKVKTPEISWHTKEAIYSVDIQPQLRDQATRLATAGIDGNVRIWEIKPELKYGVTFLANLARHDKAVNVVRFSKSGEVLASGGDDGTIILWKLSDKEEPPNIFDDDADIGKNIESWIAFKILRGHLEDINELSWSEDDSYMISGSIDHTAILWDVSKGSKISILSDAKHFIQGVAWDPLNQYVATMSCDRSLRIYNIQNHRVIHNVQKMTFPESSKNLDEALGDVAEGNNLPNAKPQRMFHDETVVRRRLGFTCDGSLMIVPAGCLSVEQSAQFQQINTAFIFVRGCLYKPAVVLPGFKDPVTVVRCCPIRFQLKSYDEDCIDRVIKLPYRMVFGVSTSDTILLFDTQHLEPFAVIGNIHYAAITDLTWSSDGRYLVVSSRDGFCTIVFFDEDELGIKYKDENKLKENEIKDAQQDTMHVDTMITDSIPAKKIPSEDDVIVISDETSAADYLVNVEHRKATPELSPNENKNTADSKLRSKSKSDSKKSSQNVGSQDGHRSCFMDRKRDENMDLDCQNEPSSKDQLPQIPVQQSLSSPSDKSIPSKGSRRVQFTTIATIEDNKMTKTLPKDVLPPNQDTTPTGVPGKHLNHIVSSMQKKTHRRIQLTPVNEKN